MSGARQGRRAFLTTAAAAGAGVASIGRASAAETEGSATDTGGLENACSRDDTDSGTGTFPIDVPSVDEPDSPDTVETIDVTVTDSGSVGPTAFIVGGVHGDEEAGIIAAHHITNWEPNTGQIAVLPEANPDAIKNNSRTNVYGDLNRKFDFGEAPATTLARTIWQALKSSDADIVFTLQESRGIYGGSPSGVGQTVFRSPGDDTYDAARDRKSVV